MFRQRISFADLPLTVHSGIVDHLSPQSILALSLTCRSLRARTYPFPLELALIRTTSHNFALWHTLATHPTFPSQVRSLTVLDPETTTRERLPSWSLLNVRIPPEVLDPMPYMLINENRFHDAIEGMTRLRYFEWCSQSMNVAETGAIQILISSCPFLEHVVVIDTMEGITNEDDISGYSEAWLSLWTLRRFDYTFKAQSVFQPMFETLSIHYAMREQCPDLTHLRIVYDFEDPEDDMPEEEIIWFVKDMEFFDPPWIWPNLVSLWIENIGFDQDDFFEFLCCHNRLEELIVHIAFDTKFDLDLADLPSSALPRLRTLSLLGFSYGRILPLIGAGRPLRNLLGFCLDPSKTQGIRDLSHGEHPSSSAGVHILEARDDDSDTEQNSRGVNAHGVHEENTEDHVDHEDDEDANSDISSSLEEWWSIKEKERPSPYSFFNALRSCNGTLEKLRFIYMEGFTGVHLSELSTICGSTLTYLFFLRLPLFDEWPSFPVLETLIGIRLDDAQDHNINDILKACPALRVLGADVRKGVYRVEEKKDDNLRWERLRALSREESAQYYDFIPRCI